MWSYLRIEWIIILASELKVRWGAVRVNEEAQRRSKMMDVVWCVRRLVVSGEREDNGGP